MSTNLSPEERAKAEELDRYMAERRRQEGIVDQPAPQGLTEDALQRGLAALRAEAARRATEEAEEAKALAADPDHRARQARARLEMASGVLIRHGFPQVASREAVYTEVPAPDRRALAAWVKDAERGNLVICGAVGVGKTWGAVWALRELACKGLACRYIHCRALISLAKRDDRAACAALAELAGCDVLLLDDLGVGGKPPEWVAGVLEELVDDRVANGRPIVVTTNCASFDDLAAMYGQPLMSRLLDRSRRGAVIEWSATEDRRVGGTHYRGQEATQGSNHGTP